MSMNHPDTARLLALARQAELLRQAAQARVGRLAWKNRQRRPHRPRSRLGRFAILLSLWWYARQHRLAQRRCGGSWRAEVLMVVHAMMPSEPGCVCPYHSPL